MEQRKSYSGWNTQNSRQMRLSVPLRCRENLTPVRRHRIQDKCGYLCLYGEEKILLPLEHIEFKANVIICALLQMPLQRKFCSSWSTQNSRQIWLSVPYSQCPTLYSSMFFLGQEMRLFGVQHSEQDMRLYSAIRSKAQLSGGIRVRIPQKLHVVAFWSWDLDVVVFWSWDLDVVVYMSPRPPFRFHSENRKNTQNILNYLEEYFNYPNFCNSYPYKVWISEL